MSFNEKFTIGPGFAWKSCPITEDLRTTLVTGNEPADDPRLEGLVWPSVGKYLGRSIGGWNLKPTFEKIDESRFGVNTLIDANLYKQGMDLSTVLQFNRDPDILTLAQLPEVRTTYDAFGGGTVTVDKFSVLIAATNFLNEEPTYRDIIELWFFFRCWSEPNGTTLGPGHNGLNITFHALSMLDANGCPVPNGRGLYHRWYVRASAPTVLIDPTNPDVAIGAAPDIPIPFFLGVPGMLMEL